MITLKNFFFCFFFLNNVTAYCQNTCFSQIIDHFDKIIHDEGSSKYFAALYKETTVKMNGQTECLPDGAKNFIHRFENNFSSYFFSAAEGYRQNQKCSSHWKPYFNADSLNELQYMAIGMNAHINGDFWIALAAAHPYDSIIKYRKELIAHQKSFNILFDSLYTIERTYSRVNFINHFTLGLDKIYVKMMVRKWRKRQIQLALLSTTDEEKLTKRLKRLNKKMERFNRFVVRWLR